MGGSKKNQLKYPESKPEDIMRQKQAMYAESIQLDLSNKLYENPDTTKIKIDDTNSEQDLREAHYKAQLKLSKKKLN